MLGGKIKRPHYEACKFKGFEFVRTLVFMKRGTPSHKTIFLFIFLQLPVFARMNSSAKIGTSGVNVNPIVSTNLCTVIKPMKAGEFNTTLKISKISISIVNTNSAKNTLCST